MTSRPVTISYHVPEQHFAAGLGRRAMGDETALGGAWPQDQSPSCLVQRPVLASSGGTRLEQAGFHVAHPFHMKRPPRADCAAAAADIVTEREDTWS